MNHTSYPPCKVCDRGALVRKKIFRMSIPVVVIGFILLIPSLIGVAVGLFALISSITPNENQEPMKQIRDRAASGLRHNGVPEATINAVLDAASEGRNEDVTRLMDDNEMPEADRSWIYDAQDKIRSAGLTQSPPSPPSPLSAAFSIGLIVGSFVGGIFGWLLVMKKRVLQCSVCGAVINAS